MSEGRTLRWPAADRLDEADLEAFGQYEAQAAQAYAYRAQERAVNDIVVAATQAPFGLDEAVDAYIATTTRHVLEGHITSEQGEELVRLARACL